MKYNSFIKAAPAVLGLILFRKRCPLAVSWALTYRCNGGCLYCQLSSLHGKELETGRILSIIEQLNQAGTRFITFTGGEPLLREDIGQIIKHAVSFGIRVLVNTNGKLVPESLKAIESISLLRVSLDGPKEINDKIRGKGSFDSTLKAIRICKDQGVKTEINTVISKINAEYIPYIIDTCSDLNVNASFQPATEFIFGQHKKNPMLPSLEQYRQAIDFLIDQKRKGCRTILNSLPSLNYLRHWPKGKKMRCAAGVLNCRIEPDGRLYACGGKPVMDSGYGVGLRERSFNDAFRQIKKPPCDGCWCNIWVDFNLLASFNPLTFLRILKERMV